MQIRKVEITNFRAIHSFEWQPSQALTCIIGAGDSAKTTILDAIEAALSPRWVSFSDVDFNNGDTTKAIQITVTVGQLPAEALREHRFGLHLRGWTAQGSINDEPHDDDEPIVSVRLTVDSSLEPVWELITDRGAPRPITSKDRSLFGVVRLDGDSERHLTWGQGSQLLKLTDNRDQAGVQLANAYRLARQSIKSGTLVDFDSVASQVAKKALEIGAYVTDSLSAGLDTQRSSTSLGALAIHEDGIPIRMFGLGTRRLVSLAVQQISIPDGAILLVDEVEHGLEPHRIRHVLRLIRTAVNKSGQAILTSHSAVTVVELPCDQLAVCRNRKGALHLNSPPDSLQSVVRRVPESLLSKKILVCEGKTEVGVLRGLKALWNSRHDDRPIESRGTVMADGNGSQAVQTACDLSKLGYEVALLRDSDVALESDEILNLAQANIQVFQWQGTVSTEQRVLFDVSDNGTQKILELAYEYFGETAVLDSILAILGTSPVLVRDYASWHVPGKDVFGIRSAIGTAAKNRNWFKMVEPGERLGTIIAHEIVASPQTPLASALSLVESWAYA